MSILQASPATAKPLVKWAGGKSMLARFISVVFPVIWHRCFALLWVCLGASSPALAQLEIQEICAANLASYESAEGTSPDWVELRNTDSSPLALAGWALSEDLVDGHRWFLPRIILQPNETVIIELDGTNRAQGLDWWSCIERGSLARFIQGWRTPPAAWMEVAFPDESWPQGAGPFGRGYQEVQTLTTHDSIFLRFEFTLTPAQLDLVQALRVDIDWDDGYILWLNGTELKREHLGPPGVPVPHHILATDNRSSGIDYSGRIDEVLFADGLTLLRAGTNIFAVQVHTQDSGGDLAVEPFVSLGFAPGTSPGTPSPRLNFPTEQARANFSISAKGSTLALLRPDGSIAQSLWTGRLFLDESLALSPNTQKWMVHRESTPAQPNITEGRLQGLTPPTISPAAGHYDTQVEVTLYHPDSSAQLRYTLDGSIPDEQSPLYSGPFTLPAQAGDLVPVRAVAFSPQRWPSQILTESYLFGIQDSMPIWSLVADPEDLWGGSDGLYANYMSDLERPLHLEYWEPGQPRVFSMNAGASIHGGVSRGYPQKSLALKFRTGYQESSVSHPFFGTEGPSDFSRLLLRNAGQDWCDAHARCGLVARIAGNMDVDLQSFRPSVVYLNGKFWGIHNIRERIDKFHPQTNYGENPDRLDLLELNGWIVHQGDYQAFFQMEDFVLGQDLTREQNYQQVEGMLDIDSFIDYMIIELWSLNRDWPNNNVKFWRPRRADGKWRWFLYDLDGALLSWGASVSDDFLPAAMSGGSTTTDLFAALLSSNRFSQKFLNRYADWLNTSLRPEQTLQSLKSVSVQGYPAMASHMLRWGKSLSHWFAELEQVSGFLRQRNPHVWGHIIQNFGLAGTWQLELDVRPQGGGVVRLAAVEISEWFEGNYFIGVPVQLEAVPAEGWEFSGFEGAPPSSGSSISLNPKADSNIIAHFRPVPSRAVVHEINYHSPDAFDAGDWVEIFNPGRELLDLSGWSVKDEDDSHQYVFPTGTVLAPLEYLVVVQDVQKFTSLHPGVSVHGPLGFGFGASGDSVRLFSQSGQLMDVVVFDDEAPWPTGPDGGGPSLELRSSWLDNSLSSSWGASTMVGGSPGSPNSIQN